MNMLFYSRPQKSESDAWNTPGCSAELFLKCFIEVCQLKRLCCSTHIETLRPIVL